MAVVLRDPCEWDPINNRLNQGILMSDGTWTGMQGCRHEAEVLVGKNRLCRSCASLPRFRRIKDQEGDRLMFCHSVFGVDDARRLANTISLHAGMIALYDVAWRSWERDNHFVSMQQLHLILMELAPCSN